MLFFMFFLVLIIQVGCGGNFTKDDISGSYIAKYSFAIDQLNLNPNGTFSQSVKIIGDTTTYTVKGIWYLESDRYTLWLKNPLNINDGHGKLSKNFNIPGTSVTQAWRPFWFFGTIRIGSDEGVPYLKQ